MDWTATTTILLIIFLAFREWRSGSKKISDEVITNYATLDKQQKDNIQECRDNLVGATKAMHELENRFTGRIANLEGKVAEKENQLRILTQVLANRNPELETVLADIRNLMKNINDINSNRVNILEKEHSEIIKKSI